MGADNTKATKMDTEAVLATMLHFWVGKTVGGWIRPMLGGDKEVKATSASTETAVA
jgi:hypothetical protein